MVRARLAGIALLAAVGLACGCSTPSSCGGCSNDSFSARLTSLFHRNRTPPEVVGVGPEIEGPPIVDPGFYASPGRRVCADPADDRAAVGAAAGTGTEARRMPYQPLDK